MVFSWRGKGWIVPIILPGFPFGADWVVGMINGPMAKRTDGSDVHIWPILLGMVLSGAFLLPWGVYLNHRRATRAIDRMTGREVMALPNHSMYGVKVEYWGLVAVTDAIIIFFFRGL
jgi:hypothetical protein